jgi:hypothetical protein
MRTHALSMVETNATMRHTSASGPYPLALVIALARGEKVRVSKDMKPVCEQLQEVYDQVVKTKSAPTSELALVVRLPASAWRLGVVVTCSIEMKSESVFDETKPAVQGFPPVPNDHCAFSDHTVSIFSTQKKPQVTSYRPMSIALLSLR